MTDYDIKRWTFKKSGGLKCKKCSKEYFACKCDRMKCKNCGEMYFVWKCNFTYEGDEGGFRIRELDIDNVHEELTSEMGINADKVPIKELTDDEKNYCEDCRNE